MIQKNSLLQIIDNSGAKTAKCIKILGGYKKKYGKTGDKIIVSIKTLKKTENKNKIQKKAIFKAIILNNKSNYKNSIGFKTFLKNNYIILLDKQNNPIANRINYFISKKLKIKFIKLISISIIIL